MRLFRSSRFTLLGFALTFTFYAEAANYCLAVRGNGENEPAHWGAVANVVERLGLPQMQAGGSSATITMFFVDAIATNPLVKNSPNSQARAALLIKSLEGFLFELTTTSEWRDFKMLYDRSLELKDTDWAKRLNELFSSTAAGSLTEAQKLIAENKKLLQDTYTTGVQLGLIRPESYQILFQAVKRLSTAPSNAESFAHDLNIARFYSGELYNAVTVFGAFNAQTDDNIFFRPGLVDFDRLALQLGRIGDFYSLQNPTADEQHLWPPFFDQCLVASKGHTWAETVAVQPRCQTMLGDMVKSHFAESKNYNFASHQIGVSIPSFPTTAVLTNSAHRQAIKAQEDYANQLNPQFGKTFSIENTEDIKFGYWGQNDLLSKINSRLDRNDEKSRRFMSLGEATWAKALGLSPAEPGLSPFKEFTVGNKSVTSAGGWSDLHPVLLLKAAGCENVVYVTRRGGESLFGQGVAKRLLNFDRPWSKISSAPESKAASKKLNNNGDPDDLTSLWAKLYNLANPESSFKKALATAEATLCSDWDAFNVKDGVSEMIRDGYNSPFFVRSTGGLTKENLSPRLNSAQVRPDVYSTFAGCF